MTHALIKSYTSNAIPVSSSVTSVRFLTMPFVRPQVAILLRGARLLLRTCIGTKLGHVATVEILQASVQMWHFMAQKWYQKCVKKFPGVGVGREHALRSPKRRIVTHTCELFLEKDVLYAQHLVLNFPPASKSSK